MRIGLFIDYANLYTSNKRLGWCFDFSKLISFLEKYHNGQLIYKHIYFAYPEEDTRQNDTSGIHKFWVFLEKNLGFVVKKKPLKRIKLKDENGYLSDTDGNIQCKEKGNFDVELTIDVMLTYQQFDVLLLFSGDSDFHELIKHIQSHKKSVYVYSARENLSSELRGQANACVDISILKHLKKTSVK